jgi:stage II sporulation protein Q
MNQNQNQNQTKSNAVQEAATPSKGSASAPAPATMWKRLLGKKWAYPAMYVVAAALILTFMWAYQQTAQQSANDALADTKLAVNSPSGQSQDMPVAANVDTLAWPVKDRTEMEVMLPFYDSAATPDQKQAALVEYGDTMTPHVGIDFARNDNQSFDVLAAGNGKVTQVEKNILVGNLIEITHANEVVSVYQSLSTVKVAKGDEVKKGQVIAQAGRNELEKDQGFHLHFELRKDGEPVNPSSIIGDR